MMYAHIVDVNILYQNMFTPGLPHLERVEDIRYHLEEVSLFGCST